MFSHIFSAMLLLFSLSLPHRIVSADPGEILKVQNNPTLSNWTLNLSGGDPEGAVGNDRNQEIAVVGSTVHVMWISNVYEEWSRKVMYRRSTDGGKSWEPALVLFKCGSDPWDGIDYNYTYKRMAVDGSTVHIVVNHRITLEDGGHGALTYLRSTDGGQTFDEPKALFTSPTGPLMGWFVTEPRISADSGKVTIGINHSASWYNNYSIVLLNSSDGGSTFSQHIAASSSTNSGNLEDLKRVGDAIYVLYYHLIATGDYGHFQARIGIAATLDNGSTFTNNLLTTSAANGEYLASRIHSLYQGYSPNIAAAGNNVYVLWIQNDTAYNSSNKVAYFCRSTDRGLTFQEPVKLSDTLPEGCILFNEEETIAAKGDYVYAAFLTTDYRIWMKRSTNGGATFENLQELSSPETPYLTSGWGTQVVVDPIEPTGKKVHVLWSSPTYRCSTDGGAHFSNPVLLSPHFTWNDCCYPQMVIDGNGAPHLVVSGRYYSSGVLWDWDVFYRRLDSQPAPSPVNMALSLSANSYAKRYDSVQISSDSSIMFSSAMTAEVWIHPTSGSGRTCRVLVKEDGPYTFNQFPGSYQIGTHDWSNARRPNAGIRTTTDRYVNWGGEEIPDNIWTHIAMTYDANGGENNFRLYVNGKLSTSLTATGTLVQGNGILFFGNNGTLDVFEGQIDEVKLWNRALSEQEIAATMLENLKGNEPGLAAYYNFNNTTRDLTGHGNDGVLMYMESFVPSDLQTDVEDRESAIPGKLMISSNYPNPFNPVTTIKFSLPEAGFTTLVIYNIMGQKVRELISKSMTPGVHYVVWDGCDNTGETVSSGGYIAKLTAGQSITTSRMTLIK